MKVGASGAFSETRHVKNVEEGEEKSVTIGVDDGDNDSANAANGSVNPKD